MTDRATYPRGLPGIIHGMPLTLRPLRLSDAVPFAEAASDMDIACMTGSFPRHFPRLSAEFKIMHMKSQKQRGLSYNYAVTKTGDDKLIGVMDLFRASQDDIFEIGYWIAKSSWGQGYATNAAHMIINTAKTHLGITRLKAGVFTDNPASLKVLQKLGFEPHGPIELYFSMARLEKAPSINLLLDLNRDSHTRLSSTPTDANH